MSGGHAPRASLPMYDWPELAWATDAFWTAIAGALRAAGIEAPGALDRAAERSEVWRDPALLLSQTCGAPFVSRLQNNVQLVATPVYDAPHCEGPRYASVVVTRRGAQIGGLAELAGKTAAVNGLDSLSGWWALRRIGLAPAAPLITGAHRASARAVADGAADYAAIDAVAFAYLGDHEPQTAAALSAAAITPPAPALPFITAAGRGADEVDALLGALRRALHEPALSRARAALRLRDVVVLSPDAYAPLSDWDPDGAKRGRA